MNISKCRICKNTKFQNLFNLGKLAFTGKFPKNIKINIPKKKISLLMCKRCKLVQLSQNFNEKYLYGKDYGYRTGINKTMTNHVKTIANEGIKLVKPRNKDYLLDIASNDGTLLNYYKKKYKTFGVDPLIQKYSRHYKSIDYKVSSFFSKAFFFSTK